MLEPVRLADTKDVARRLQRRHVGVLVGRVGDDEVDVDERLRREAGHRCRADVLEQQHLVTERAADLLLARANHSGQAGS